MVLNLSLKTPNWVEQAKEEIGLCSSNTVPLYTSPSQSDYNCLGIPDVNKTRSAPPSRPPPPSIRSPVPSPKRVAPVARVISMPRPSVPPNIPPPDLPQEESDIYEEISDDIVSAPEPQGPPPPPPRPEPVQPSTPSRGPPPVPARSAPPPPLPARPRQ